MKVYITNSSLIKRKNCFAKFCDLESSKFNNQKFLRRHDRSALLLFSLLADLLSLKKIQFPKSIVLESVNNTFNSTLKYSKDLNKGGYLNANPIDFVNMSDNSALGYAAQYFSLSHIVQLVSNDGLEYAFQLIKHNECKTIVAAGIDEFTYDEANEGGGALFLTNHAYLQPNKEIVELIDVDSSANIPINDTKRIFINNFIEDFFNHNLKSSHLEAIFGGLNLLSDTSRETSKMVRQILMKYTHNLKLTSSIVGQSKSASLYQSISLLLSSFKNKDLNSTKFYAAFNINLDNTITLVFLKIGG